MLEVSKKILKYSLNIYDEKRIVIKAAFEQLLRSMSLVK